MLTHSRVAFSVLVGAVLASTSSFSKHESLSVAQIQDLMTKNQEVADTIDWLCYQAPNSCRSKCGRRKDKQYTLDKSKVRTCSCDVKCILFGDCCWDFWNECPKEVFDFEKNFPHMRTAKVSCRWNNLIISKCDSNDTDPLPDTTIPFDVDSELPISNPGTNVHYIDVDTFTCVNYHMKTNGDFGIKWRLVYTADFEPHPETIQDFFLNPRNRTVEIMNHFTLEPQTETRKCSQPADATVICPDDRILFKNRIHDLGEICRILKKSAPESDNNISESDINISTTELPTTKLVLSTLSVSQVTPQIATVGKEYSFSTKKCRAHVNKVKDIRHQFKAYITQENGRVTFLVDTDWSTYRRFDFLNGATEKSSLLITCRQGYIYRKRRCSTILGVYLKLQIEGDSPEDKNLVLDNTQNAIFLLPELDIESKWSITHVTDNDVLLAETTFVVTNNTAGANIPKTSSDLFSYVKLRIKEINRKSLITKAVFCVMFDPLAEDQKLALDDALKEAECNELDLEEDEVNNASIMLNGTRYCLLLAILSVVIRQFAAIN